MTAPTPQPTASEPVPPDRVWTIPNALSALRLLGVPVFLWLVLGPEADGAALGILAFAGVSDYLDGKLARALNQTSRLGVLLDPLADRLYILSTIIALTVREIVPIWLAVLLLA
ncbi:CDP-alcohol phosphatidyltransferase family protein, partial [Frankia sp. AvcI1]